MHLVIMWKMHCVKHQQIYQILQNLDKLDKQVIHLKSPRYLTKINTRKHTVKFTKERNQKTPWTKEELKRNPKRGISTTHTPTRRLVK